MRRMKLPVACALGLLAGVSASGLPRQQPAPAVGVAWPPAIEPVASPAAASSGQPQLTVSPHGVLLSWVERDGSRATLRFAERSGRGWSAPVTVAAGDDWFVNWADVPSVLRLDDGTLVAHWLRKSGPSTYAYDVRLSYSKDGGRTWSSPFSPHHDGTATEHGFASLFQAPAGGLGLVWLDGRAMAAGGHGAGGGHGGGGAMSLRHGRFDAAWTQTRDEAVDLRVCECCPTSAVVTSEGPLVAFRNRSDREVRDIFVSRLEGGAWSTPRAVHDDGWRIAACPVNGPMLDAHGRDVVVAWFTVKGDVGHAYAAFSTDAGRSFGPPVRLHEASALGRVDVALLPDGTAVASWVEFKDKRATFSMRRVERSGRTSPMVEVTPVSSARTSGYPRLAFHGGELVFAWTETEGGTSQVKTAAAALGVPSAAAR